MMEIGKSPVHKHHGKNWLRQDHQWIIIMDNHQRVGNMWSCGIEVSVHTSLINSKGGKIPFTAMH